MSSSLEIIRDLRRFDLDADVGQTTFTFPRPLFDALDLRVQQKIAPAAAFSNVAGGYIVTPAADRKSASVVFAVPPRQTAEAPAVTIRLDGARIATRTTDVTRSGSIVAALLERELDLFAIIAQELRRDINGVGPDILDAASTTAAAAIRAEAAATRAEDIVVGIIPAGSIGTDEVADGAVTLAKLADSLLDGTAGALIRWAAGGAYPAGGGAKITGVIAASVAAGATGTTAAATDSSTKLATTAQVQAAIAAKSVFAKTFESAPQTFTASGSLTVAHSLGVLPKLVTAEAQVTTAFGIYAVGDRISIASLDWSASGNGSYGAILGYDATNIRVSFGNQPAFGPVPSMTASNVVIILRAFA